MNEMINGTTGIVSTVMMAIVILIGLVVWFFVNRASVRASQQIQLLEALLDEQKKQNVLLRRLTDAVVGKESAERAQDAAANKDFTRLIPER